MRLFGSQHESYKILKTFCVLDQIRPDWEERLAAVKAAVARRANRRIIMRQVGDRLIPVGVTSSRTQLPEGITTVEVSLLPFVVAPSNSSFYTRISRRFVPYITIFSNNAQFLF